jgi:alkylation response protein AidB-like acyl-CoA dehydrogenase
MTSGAKSEGRFGKQDFVYLANENVYRCPTGEKLKYRFTAEEHGSLVDVAIIMEEINKPSSDLAMMFGGVMFCGLNVLRMGTQEQKEKWLPRVISGEIKLSIGLSEPDAGSDLGAIRTSALLDGDQWIINGLKTWQSGGRVGQRDQPLCKD